MRQSDLYAHFMDSKLQPEPKPEENQVGDGLGVSKIKID
jgi:hypothetical protein